MLSMATAAAAALLLPGRRVSAPEPVAFMGGVFAGLLRLDLNEDPLKEWLTRTVEASGIAEENNTEESTEGSQSDAPQEIEIE
ncbi:hypothetical protein PR202_gb14931 [Eleusine coracana subsp. coracana]|uniref:Uncharacterized protein n=1 Tax=Eleusine coracana subsp. coracana TaxID=191504 RepID=A0AAV5EX24_ELECO|nr:hypothetical protein PR202_gb14931 [Eleusine coracana subsp. coracana]